MTELSKQDMEMVELLAAGLSRQQIAAQLNLSLGGTAWRIGRLYRRLGAFGRAHAVYLAYAGHLLEQQPGRRAVVRVPLDPPEVIEARRRVLLGEEETTC